MATELLTIGVIARRLGVNQYRILRAITYLRLKPASRAANLRIFTEPDVARIQERLRVVEAGRNPPREPVA